MSTPVTPEIQRRPFDINDITSMPNQGNDIVQLNQDIDNIINNINIINRNLIDLVVSNTNDIPITTSSSLNNNTINTSGIHIARINSNSFINDERDPQYSQLHQRVENNSRIYSNNLTNNSVGISRISSNHSISSKLSDIPPDIININDIEEAIPSSSSISNSRNADNPYDDNITDNRSSLYSIPENQQENSITNRYIRSSENINNLSENNLNSNDEVIDNNNPNPRYRNDQTSERNIRRPVSNEIIYRLVEVSPGVFQMRGITVNNTGQITPPVTTINRNTTFNANDHSNRNGNSTVTTTDPINHSTNNIVTTESNLNRLISNRYEAHENMANNYVANEINS
ncbi:hypothetical protein U3516DRAFT_525723, partial [Neocallimastix sp. 'constans']